jgi:hypothetical protein
MTEWSALVISSGRAEHQQPPTQDPPTTTSTLFRQNLAKERKGTDPRLRLAYRIAEHQPPPSLHVFFFFSFFTRIFLSPFPSQLYRLRRADFIDSGLKKTTALYKNLLCIGLYF